MSIARASRIRNEMCFIQVCIDTFDNGEIRGRLFNAYYREALFFESSMDMLRQMDEVFETFGYPHATMDLRRFDTSDNDSGKEGTASGQGERTSGQVRMLFEQNGQEPAAPKPRTMLFEQDGQEPAAPKPRTIRMAPTQTLYKHNVKGQIATLRLRIMFRQNASWQGTAKWVEEDLEESFQSVLELLLLIDSMFAA